MSRAAPSPRAPPRGGRADGGVVKSAGVRLQHTRRAEHVRFAALRRARGGGGGVKERLAVDALRGARQPLVKHPSQRRRRHGGAQQVVHPEVLQILNRGHVRRARNHDALALWSRRGRQRRRVDPRHAARGEVLLPAIRVRVHQVLSVAPRELKPADARQLPQEGEELVGAARGTSRGEVRRPWEGCGTSVSTNATS